MNNGKKIKILQINKLYYLWIGGVERVVQNIAEGLQHRVDMKVLVCRSRGRSVIEQVNDDYGGKGALQRKVLKLFLIKRRNI